MEKVVARVGTESRRAGIAVATRDHVVAQAAVQRISARSAVHRRVAGN
jgi:hypothetical protein